ncbi:MAG TPA: hypothetical protein VKB19_17170 [Pedobacter sp.]|nr:hypothetical protein [Pedobacter sp.]
MKPFNNNNRKKHHLGLGILFLVLGSLFLLNTIGFIIPFWILSWHTVLLALGLWFGYRKNFKAGGWVVMVLVGGIFTLKDVIFFDISGYTTAMLFIGMGLYLILKPKKEVRFCDFGNRKERVNFDNQVE